MGRSKSQNRCERCWIFRPLCLCSEIPEFRLDTRLVVVMHCKERKLTTNTGRLAALALPNSEIRMRGGRGAADERNFSVPGHTTALLYPLEDAQELTPELVRTLPRPLALIVPDGTWRQARRIANRVAADRDILRVRAPAGSPSEYRLRRESREENLSTFEAVTRAIAVLENRPEMRRQLEELFRKMVERRLWGRGKISASECTTEIPEEAWI